MTVIVLSWVGAHGRRRLPIDARGHTVHWLEPVDPQALALIEKVLLGPR